MMPTPAAPPENLTKFLAAYGAILSSIGLGWTLFRDLRDRSKLQIDARVRRIARSGDGKWYAVNHNLEVADASRDLFVVMTAVNVGRRPLVWEGWGGDYDQPVKGKTGFAIIPQNLPRKLNEGESHAEMTKLEDDLRPAADNVKRLFLWDTTGRKWILSRRQLKALKKEARAATTAQQ